VNYVTKCQLFLRAMGSPEARAEARKYVGRHITPELGREVRAAVLPKMREYLFDIGSEDVADEVVEELVVVQHRFEHKRFALGMRSSLLPSGESQDGEWERVDDVPAPVGNFE